MKRYIEKSIQKLDEQFSLIMQQHGKITIFYEDLIRGDRKIIGYVRHTDGTRSIIFKGTRDFVPVNINSDNIYVIE